jgi:hypothetical protein
MAVISTFGGLYSATAYAYGVIPTAPAPLQIITGSTVSGTFTITCQSTPTAGNDGVKFNPTTNTPILVGSGTSQETVTPTAVTLDNLGNILITAAFANAHSAGDTVRSGTVGLQEAVNAAGAAGGGVVLLSAPWANYGGTSAMIAAAVVPVSVSIVDNRTGGIQAAGNVPSSVTALAAPTAVSTAAATNGLLTTASTGGTIAASAGTFRLGVTYVDALGGETTLSVDTASTATIAIGSATSTNSIGLTSPAALAGAIGYRVYMTAASGASLSEILYPVGNSAITGTAVANAPIPCFQIGTPVTITAIITGTAKVPAQNSAYALATIETLGAPVTSYPPFTALGTIAAAATGTVGEVNFSAGFFNALGRTVRFKGMAYATTNGTGGTLTFEMILASIYGVTSITPFTAVTASVAASAITVNMLFDILLVTAATGATGNFECHGSVEYNVAGTAVGSVTMDNVIAVSSNLDLTKQITMSIAHLNTTLGTTASQLRQLTVEVLQ